MISFCRTEAAGQENQLFGTEREYRWATRPIESQQRIDYRYRNRSRVSGAVVEGVNVRSGAGKKHETELVRITKTRSTVGAENG